jgi:CSLREA domain-containing protein
LTLARAIVLVALVSGASGATFTVNTPVDGPDAVPGNGVCEIAPGNGVCTLRAAIMEANAFPGVHTVHLPQTVSPLVSSPFPGSTRTMARRAISTSGAR